MSVQTIDPDDEAHARRIWRAIRDQLPRATDDDLKLISRVTDAVLDVTMKERAMAKSAGSDDNKSPNTGSNTTQRRDDKMTTTDKSRDPNRPHADR